MDLFGLKKDFNNSLLGKVYNRGKSGRITFWIIIGLIALVLIIGTIKNGSESKNKVEESMQSK